MPTLLLEHLAVRDFRNLERVDLDLAPRLNVISGDNGQGKTSLLEAIYFVATSRSFRTHRAHELVRHGQGAASVRAAFAERDDAAASIAREQLASIDGKRCLTKLDGNRPSSLADYATRSPIVAFHPDELALSSGPATGRRTLLDRIALFMDRGAVEHRGRYAAALRARQRLIQEQAGDAGIRAFEELCAKHGAALTRARSRAAAELEQHVLPAFRAIAAPDLELTMAYAPGGSPDEAESLAELERRRARDAHRPSASFGAHRDDLDLRLGGHAVRLVASQGQHRAITLALKTGETAAIARARGVEPILLLDDVSSELDPDRTAALFRFLRNARGQIILSTTRPDLIDAPNLRRSERRNFVLREGSLVNVETP